MMFAQQYANVLNATEILHIFYHNETYICVKIKWDSKEHATLFLSFKANIYSYLSMLINTIQNHDRITP